MTAKASEDLLIDSLVGRLAAAALARGVMLVTAESCTGGLVASAMTSVSGSSAWFDRGFVTYSNEAKVDQLDVDPATIERFGAVSEEVSLAMAAGALAASAAQWSVAVTGVAGPTGGSAEKPVGTVWFAWAGPSGVERDPAPSGRQSGRRPPAFGADCAGRPGQPVGLSQIRRENSSK